MPCFLSLIFFMCASFAFSKSKYKQRIIVGQKLNAHSALSPFPMPLSLCGLILAGQWLEIILTDRKASQGIFPLAAEVRTGLWFCEAGTYAHSPLPPVKSISSLHFCLSASLFSPPFSCLPFLSFPFPFIVLGIKFRTSCKTGKHCITEPHP